VIPLKNTSISWKFLQVAPNILYTKESLWVFGGNNVFEFTSISTIIDLSFEKAPPGHPDHEAEVPSLRHRLA